MANLGQPQPKIYKSQQMVQDQVVWEYGQPDLNPYRAEWQILVDAIRQDTPHNEGRRAGEANLATLMGRMATHTGRYVTWEEALNSNFEYIADIDKMTENTPAPIQAGPDGMYAAPQPGLTKEV
jgi:hypothetical protein